MTHDADRSDVMTLACETTTPSDALATAVGASIREVCKLRGEVSFLTPGSLPNDGKVIEDLRRYD